MCIDVSQERIYSPVPLPLEMTSESQLLTCCPDRCHSLLKKVVNLFIFGCSVAVRGLSLVAVSQGYPWWQSTGSSLQGLLLLQSTGSQPCGLQ